MCQKAFWINIKKMDNNGKKYAPRCYAKEIPNQVGNGKTATISTLQQWQLQTAL